MNKRDEGTKVVAYIKITYWRQIRAV